MLESYLLPTNKKRGADSLLCSGAPQTCSASTGTGRGDIGVLRESKFFLGFPDGSDGKDSACTAGNPGLIPGWGFNPLAKEVATLSSILAWEIFWTEEPGRLQSRGLQRVGHDWVTNAVTFFSSYC